MAYGELSQTMRVIQRGMAAELHLGAQVYASVRGQVVADEAIGESRPGVPMDGQTLLLWLSAVKPVGAVAIAQLWERGQVDLDDPVARHIPEFAQHGKQSVTIRHVLTHTGGFRAAASNTSAALSWQQIIERICRSQLEPGWVPGRRAGYHVASGWFILGEIVQRVDGRPYSQYVREEIFLPLGMNDSWVGMPPEQYQAYGPRIGLMQVTEKRPAQPLGFFTTEKGATACRPGANGYGPARELGRFYEMMLNRGELSGQQVLRPQTVEALIARHRVGLVDETFGQELDWGLGFIINSERLAPGRVPYGFGPHASARTFGHGGSQSSVGLGDPEHGLAAVIIFNGTPGEAAHQERIRATLTALYEDLSLRS